MSVEDAQASRCLRGPGRALTKEMHQEAQNFGFRWPLIFRALRHRNYCLFFSAQIISLVGAWMQSVAQSWLVSRLTASSLLLGPVGFPRLIHK